MDIKFEMSECTPAVERGMKRIGRWLNQDQIQLMRATLSQHRNGARAAALGNGQPSAPPAFEIFKEHLLLCGLLLWDAKASLQKTGIFDICACK